MKRIEKIILKNFWRIPGLLGKLNRRIRHPENYTDGERMEPIRVLYDIIKKSGDISVEISGKEHILSEGGFILYSNHQGLFDAVAIAGEIHTPVSPVINMEGMSDPLLKKFFACADALPVEQKDFRQSLQMFEEVKRRVEKGKVCLIFPEGKRNTQGNFLMEFQAESFDPAVETRCPIIPVALVDSFKPFDTDAEGHITVYIHILKPLLWIEYARMTTAEIVQTVQERIRKEMASILMKVRWL